MCVCVCVSYATSSPSPLPFLAISLPLSLPLFLHPHSSLTPFSFPLPSPPGYVFENLPGGWFNDTVRLLLSLELTLTFPIVFKPASEVAEEILYNFMMVQYIVM